MKNFFATLCVLVIIFLFPFVLLGTLAQTQVLTVPSLKQFVRSSDIAGQLPNLIVTKMQESMENEQGSADGQEGNGDGPSEQEIADMKQQITDALPPETVNGIFDQVIDSGATWWKSDMALEKFPLVLNIAPYKEEIKPLLKNTELITNDDGSLPDTIDLQSLLTIQAQNKPDDFVKYNEQITQAHTSLKQARLLIVIGWIVIALCFLGIGLLVRTPGQRIPKWFGWVGVVLFLEAASLLAVVYFLPSFIQPLIGSNGAPAEATVAFSLLQVVSVALWHGLAVVLGVLVVFTSVAFVVQSQFAQRAKA